MAESVWTIELEGKKYGAFLSDVEASQHLRERGWSYRPNSRNQRRYVKKVGNITKVASLCWVFSSNEDALPD